MFKVMAVNVGSSSVKFKLYEMPEEKVLSSGIVERIGHEDGIFTLKNEKGVKIVNKVLPVKDHEYAVNLVINGLVENGIVKDLHEIKGIGHRIVQGGPYFSDSHIFDEDTEKKIESLIPLAPLHNGPHLVGYHAFKKALPDVGQVAVFDTSFHQTMEPADYLYPVKYEYYEKYKVRRYGAHGTSHRYLAGEAIHKYLHDKKDSRIITLHIGSGSSISAIRDGKCVLTSMGLTPLGGIMMGARTGDMDPSVFNYLIQCTGKKPDDLFQEFNKQSGLLGITGISNDTRDIQEAAEKGDKKAQIAIKMWSMKLAQFIVAYASRLGHVDLIVWSAGIGENAPFYRQKVTDELSEFTGIRLDPQLNDEVKLGKEGYISAKDSSIPVVVIPTDEELMIARDVVRLLKLK